MSDDLEFKILAELEEKVVDLMISQEEPLIHDAWLRSRNINHKGKMRILMLGITGSGKSQFISDVLKIKVKVSGSLKSVTQKIESYGDNTMEMIDSPGFDDTEGKTIYHIKEFQKFSKQNVSLTHVIIMLPKIDKLTESNKSILTMYLDLLGHDQHRVIFIHKGFLNNDHKREWVEYVNSLGLTDWVLFQNNMSDKFINSIKKFINGNPSKLNSSLFNEITTRDEEILRLKEQLLRSNSEVENIDNLIEESKRSEAALMKKMEDLEKTVANQRKQLKDESEEQKKKNDESIRLIRGKLEEKFAQNLYRERERQAVLIEERRTEHRDITSLNDAMRSSMVRPIKVGVLKPVSDCSRYPAILKSGMNKGRMCGRPSRYGLFCGYHG